jgi:hypothetical protein
MKFDLRLVIGAMAILLASAQLASAAVTAEEAAKLKTTLTPFGAEKAGNKEGTIPAWDGGYTQVPADYKSGQPRPDPFANEKPILTITAQNMDQYADKLAEGVKALLKKYPSYRVDVYPTHRTAAAPQWVYDNTFKNATRAKLVPNGMGVEGAYGGIPFPIPKDGYEAISNHLLAWKGESINEPFISAVVTADGKRVMSAVDKQTEYPYYYKDGSPESFKGINYLLRLVTTAPPFSAGEALILRETTNFAANPRQTWQYLTGQRRVRKAPSFEYDAPNFGASGVTNVDESLVFTGAMDRYEMKLVGKKEMFIPYNNNRFYLAKDPTVVLGPQHLNPDYVRWELHRVWVVDATLAPGKRHTVPHRRFYLDEDTWGAILADAWDAQGQLWKLSFATPLLAYELPAVAPQKGFGLYNLQTGVYQASDLMNGLSVHYESVPRQSASFFTPENLAGTGVR